MNKSHKSKEDRILEAVLPLVPFHGWKKETVLRAARGLGYDKDDVKEAFPSGTWDLLRHFSDWIDRKMLEKLPLEPDIDSKIRDRIKDAVMVRFEVMLPYKEAVRLSRSFWMMPVQSLDRGKALWSTADKIWNWAGDDSQDYNFYTKRGSLSAIIAATIFAWFKDDSKDLSYTGEFLERRIDELLRVVRYVKFYKKRKA